MPASVSIVSAPESGDAYGLGENIQVEITFTELVHVTGEPVLILSIGANSRSSEFVSGSGTEVLLFRYTVQAGDLDEDGISIAADALREGDITRATGGLVSTRLPALPAQGGHKVDGLVAPRVARVEIVSPAGERGYLPGGRGHRGRHCVRGGRPCDGRTGTRPVRGTEHAGGGVCLRQWHGTR